MSWKPWPLASFRTTRSPGARQECQIGGPLKFRAHRSPAAASRFTITAGLAASLKKGGCAFDGLRSSREAEALKGAAAFEAVATLAPSWRPALRMAPDRAESTWASSPAAQGMWQVARRFQARSAGPTWDQLGTGREGPANLEGEDRVVRHHVLAHG